MDDLLDRQQRALFFEFINDLRVRFLVVQPRKHARFLIQVAARVHRHNRRHIVLLAGNEVFHTMSRRCMNAAGTRFQRDMVSQNDKRIPVNERMARLHQLQIAPLEGRHSFIAPDPRRFAHAVHQLRRQHVGLVVRHLHQAILKIRIQADRHVARQRPGRGRPNHKVNLAQSLKFPKILRSQKFDKNGVCLILAVLDFRFRKRSLTFWTPINRFQAFINKAFLRHFAKNFNLRRLKLRKHCQIRMFPICDPTQTLKLLFLIFDIFQRKITAGLAKLHRAGLVSVDPQLFDRLLLDRKAVRIPAGYIRRAESVHVFKPDDNILQYLIQHMPRVNVAVCIRRAVVQDKRRLIRVFLHQFSIQVLFLPFFQDLRFTRR